MTYSAPSPWAPRPSDTVAGRYSGTAGPLLRLGLVTATLTLVTLGVYRFWARTRIRRYIWSAASLGGDRFQYTGSGLEKLLGFLVAVIILAFCLGALQIGLYFLNLSVFSPSETPWQNELHFLAAQASLIVLAPLYFLARYRALRYRLSRTRWRGVRFGLENAGWAYAWRALGLTLLTIATLGLMLPYQTYRMAKFRTDRTSFGNARFRLEGRWTSLFRSTGHFVISAATMVAALVAMATGAAVLGAIVFFLGLLWVFVGFVHYRVDSTRRLTAMTTLGDDVAFRLDLPTARVVRIAALGGFAIMLIYGVAVVFVTQAFVGAFDFDPMSPETSLASVAVNTLIVVIALLAAGPFTLVLITQPILARAVAGLTVENASALERIRQQAEADQVDADGLADALDFGGAI